MIELGPHAIARTGQGLTDAGLVPTGRGMAFERGRVGSGTESTALAGHDDDPDIRIVLGVGEHGSIFGVHPTGPGVEPVRAIERDRRDRSAHRIFGRMQFHRPNVPGWQ